MKPASLLAALLLTANIAAQTSQPLPAPPDVEE
jgi:hypothetical protein